MKESESAQLQEKEAWKRAVGEAAAALIEPGMVIGLGSGSTAEWMIRALGHRLQQEGLRIAGAVPTSERTEAVARAVGIPLTDLDHYPELDLDIDGTDEIDPHLHLIKGGGGALLREKVVASASRRFVVIADVTKQVPLLGLHVPLPIETVPFALTPVRRRLEALGAEARLRQRDGQPFYTDNGNLILDCYFPDGIADPGELENRLRRIVGVVETGLFLHMTTEALIAGPGGITHLARRSEADSSSPTGPAVP
ncbi:ribose-5-phosphate isomerase RpiA [Thermogemmatispora tikiterensis]|uniref:Ribose-5-phosphate isomerase A n=1 Tax=Thermogemmatispora tikiterensis TaxID=1825093 RepID=A0A328VEW6_9CHLR|nr:ribose-5-phosphate isomerase RpiA [Thermogemmatispora tikiterensis]RAQ95381.1 ribose 5-phosphate isomerase A [Thermogemmatispora tikiterensis]